MIQIDPSQGINLKFKVNLTGATFEQLSAWANIEPSDSSVSYQIPATIENGVLTLNSKLENVAISEKGNIKIKVQHGSNLHDVWNSEYKTAEKVQIVLEQIREEKKIEHVKPTTPKEVKVVEKVEVKEASKPITKVEKKIEKVVETKKEVVKEHQSPKIDKVVEQTINDEVEKIFKFSDFK